MPEVMPSEATARQLTMSVEEFLRWEGEPETRYELIRGVPVAMSPPSRNHGVLVLNVGLALASVFAKRPLRVGIVEAGLPSPTGASSYYQADLVVACAQGESDGPEEPLVIVEVLSPSTESQDRKLKLVDYRRIESVQEILLIDQERHYCEVHHRLEGDRWLVDLIVDPEESVKLESLDAELPLSALYRGVDTEEAPREQPA